MQRIIGRMLGAAAVLLMSAGAAHAATFEVQVPFSFKVEGRSLSAGRYRVETEGDVAYLQKESGTGAAIVMMTPGDSPNPTNNAPALGFERTKNGISLTNVWVSSEGGFERSK